jgi:GNAT superfamily N-acetyltransferase
LYVDDLVTDEAHRSSGWGRQLLRWLTDEARRHACAKLVLDSGVQRVDAHRFYLANGMTLFGHHFRMDL